MQLNQNQTRFSVHLSQESNKNCSVDRNPAHGGGSPAINAGSNLGIRNFFSENLQLVVVKVAQYPYHWKYQMSNSTSMYAFTTYMNTLMWKT